MQIRLHSSQAHAKDIRKIFQIEFSPNVFWIEYPLQKRSILQKFSCGGPTTRVVKGTIFPSFSVITFFDHVQVGILKIISSRSPPCSISLSFYFFKFQLSRYHRHYICRCFPPCTQRFAFRTQYVTKRLNEQRTDRRPVAIFFHLPL